ncbi:hypothetical protein [Turicimonas muris]|uniref:hypothetical protein n=1 Tax=Turicimonas muris TaxID=1796652 RepID=UPI0032B2B517
MPARRSVELMLEVGENTLNIAFSVDSSTADVALTITSGPEIASVDVPVNDFKDFISLLEGLKSALVMPVHKVG